MREGYNPKDIDGNTVREVLRQPLTPLTTACFHGVGVYLLYYFGDHEIYADLPSSRLIYIGKSSKRVSDRLTIHFNSLVEVADLDPADFKYRWLHMKEDEELTTERLLIRKFKPWWNHKRFFGFGNCGSHRLGGKASAWDVIHPGRARAAGLLLPDGTRAEAARMAAVTAKQNRISDLFGSSTSDPVG